MRKLSRENENPRNDHQQTKFTSNSLTAPPPDPEEESYQEPIISDCQLPAMWEINVAIGATGSTAFFSRVQTKKQTLSQQVMLSGGGDDRQCYPCGMRAGHLSLSLIYFSLASLCLLKSRARQRIASRLFPKPGGVNRRMRLPPDFTATILWLVTHQPHILISNLLQVVFNYWKALMSSWLRNQRQT